MKHLKLIWIGYVTMYPAILAIGATFVIVELIQQYRWSIPVFVTLGVLGLFYTIGNIVKSMGIVNQ